MGKKVNVRATVTLDTSFESYEKAKLNKMALSQIKTWIIETLSEDDNIPLFVTKGSGEETGPLKIKVVIGDTDEKRK